MGSERIAGTLKVRSSRRPLLACLAILVVAASFIVAEKPVSGTFTYLVDTTADTVLIACSGSANDCSLRGAISNAASSPGSDTILFSSSIFPPGAPATIALGTSLPTMSNDDIIDGAGAGVQVNGVTDSFTCFTIAGTNNTIVGIELISNCTKGIWINGGSSNTIGGANSPEGACGAAGDEDADGYHNDGCPQAGSAPEPPAFCSNAIDDDGFDGDGAVNDGCPARGEGIVISDNSVYGIQIDFPGAVSNQVLGNYIGTNAAGTSAVPNALGVLIDNGAQSNVVGGNFPEERNVISGNSTDGVAIEDLGTTDNVVKGNYIGLQADGTSDRGNTIYGVAIRSGATNNIIGGTTDGAGNVVSGNDQDGIFVHGATTTDNVIQGNLVGTNAAGMGDVGNGFRGIEIEAPNNIIGGFLEGARNVVSGNDRGIAFEGSITTGNVARGNYVGVGVDGVTAIGNTNQGIWVGLDADGQTIGGTVPGEGNLLARNGSFGIGVLADNNVVQGNTVQNNGGVGGVYLAFGTGNSIGGVSPGAANTITANSGDGVFVDSVAATSGQSIRGNSIYGNVQLGIDLSPDGVTANDAGDVDTGPNGLMNFPVITSTAFAGGQTTVSGTLDTAIPESTVVDVYSSDGTDPSGNGEGRVHLGSATPDVNGAWTLIVGGAQPYTNVSATATDQNGSTSEFSATLAPTLGEGMPVNTVGGADQPTPIGGTFSTMGTPDVSSSGDTVFWSSNGSSVDGIFKNSGGTVTKLVAEGDATPIGGTFIDVGQIPVLNFPNELAFYATVTGGSTFSGIFRRLANGSIVKVAATGETAPGGDTFDSFISGTQPALGINSAGDIAFWARLSTSGHQGVFLYSAATGTLSTVARTGDSTPLGGTFSTFWDPNARATNPSINDSKQVAFLAFINGGSAGQGIFLRDGTSLTKIAAANEAAPGGGTYTSVATFGRGPVVNDSGQVAFTASVTGPPTQPHCSFSGGAFACGIYRYFAGETTRLLVSGDAGPIGVGGTTVDFSSVFRMNDAGQISIWTDIQNGLADQAIVRIGNTVESVGATGNPTPMGGTLGNLAGISGVQPEVVIPGINNQGQVAFLSMVNGGSGPWGTFVVQPPTPGQVVVKQGPVAGSAAPGTNGGTFGANFDLDINGGGKAVFGNTVQGGTSSAGVFLFFAGSATQDISLQGQPAPGGGTYSNFSPPVNNDANTIVGRATTAGGPGEGLYLFFAGSPDQSVALKGNALPSGTTGTYNTFGDPQINNVGQIAANATINGGSSTEGLFLFFAGQPVTSAKTQALKNDAAPGGQTFLFFAGSPSISSDPYGRITQRITLNGGGEGLYLFFAGQPVSQAQKLAKTGDPVPGGGTFLFFAGSPAINSNGSVVAVANYNDGTEKTGLFLFFAGQPGIPSSQPPIKLADLTTAPPGGVGGSFTGFSSPTLTDGISPEVVARATVTGGTVSEGLFMFFAGSAVQTVVKQGDPVPNSDVDDTFSSSPPVFPFHAMNNGVQVVFVGNVANNAATTQGIFLASLDGDSDGIVDFHDNCPTLTNTDQRNTDSSLAIAGATTVGDALGNSCDADDDNDQFSDTVEALAGTNPIDNCSGTGPGSAGDSWPPDVTANKFVDTADIVLLTNFFGILVAPAGPAPARYNLAPDPPNPNPSLRFVDTVDVVKLTNLFGIGCQ